MSVESKILAYPATQKKRGFSLSQYISMLLAIAAIVPLIATIISIEAFLRPALISQVSAALESDAQKRINQQDAYFVERLNDIQSLSQSTPVKNLLTGDPASKNLVFDALFTAQHRDVANYLSWTVLNPQSQVVLSYPTAPQAHNGKYLILPEALQQLKQSGKIVVSDVFYNPTTGSASVDIYARVVNDNFGILGYVRASLGLSRVWQPVNSETQANGAGSYAFILDQNGVRIAYTDPNPLSTARPTNLFKSISPLSASLQQRIKTEDLYGNSTSPVKIQPDDSLSHIQSTLNPSPTFEITIDGQTFQAARFTSTIVPWTYYILKPLNAVTGIADQQLLSILIIVTIVLVIAVFIGLLTGRRIALPILRSVGLLRKNSQALKTLANEEHIVANEQSWMVEASQAGLQSVTYYSNASRVAVERIHAISNDLAQDRNLDAQKLHAALTEIINATKYIERANGYQSKMNDKVLSTLRVTTQAAEQLTKGAEATDSAAAQLEQIVNQLTSVVGERDLDTIQS